MAFVLIREVEFKSSAQLFKAMPALIGISKMWSDLAPSMPFQLSRSIVGNPLRIRWTSHVNSIDEFHRLFAQMQQRPEYIKHTELIAECADLHSLCDEIWQTLS